MENPLCEMHKKETSSALFGADVNALTLLFTPKPDVPAGYTGVLILEHPAALPEACTTISAGHSGLGIVMENPVLPVDDRMIEDFSQANGMDKAAAQNMYVLNQYSKLAQTIAKTFFLSAKDVDPKIIIRHIKKEDGALHIKSAQFIMTGKANHHPYWNPDCV